MASSISDWLFGSSTNPKINSSSVVTQGQPEWYLEFIKNLIGKSSGIAAEPYQAYTGQRFANPSADTTSSYNMTRSNIGSWQPGLTTGINTLTGIANQSADNVMDMLARRGQQNLNENLLPSIEKTFIGSGQFGSNKMQDFMGRAVRDTNQSILDAQSGAFLQNQAQRAQAAQGLGDLSDQQQAAGLKDAAALQAIGGQQEGREQQSLDAAYQQFLEERNYPRDTAQFMSQIIRGYNPPTSTSTTTSAPATASQMAPNPLAQLAGAGAGIYGAGKAFGAFKSGGKVDMREGGAVPHGIGNYAKGGWVKDAIKKPGALHRDLGIPEGKKIPVDVLNAAAKKPGKVGQRARLAKTMRGFKHADGGKVGIGRAA